MEGDINAFQSLFARFQQPLRSYLYRLTANRSDASLKTWVFQIATNLAANYLKRRRRWTADVSIQAKNLVLGNATLAASIETVAQTSPHGHYDIREHINTCFTCVGKNLPIENQVAIILREIYDFPVAEICLILAKSEGVVKYLLQDVRTTMTDIFEARCALINKKGVCNQCSELDGWFNPKQARQEALVQIDLVRGSHKYNRHELLDMRIKLVKGINPLTSNGHELQDILLRCNRLAMGEAEY